MEDFLNSWAPSKKSRIYYKGGTQTEMQTEVPDKNCFDH